MKILMRALKNKIKINDPIIKGNHGELLVKKTLSSFNYVINDIIIKDTQVDHILICSKGIFILETKNLQGLIKGNDDDFFWYQYNKSKTRFYSPIRQNEYHLKMFNEVFKEYKNFVKTLVIFTNRVKIRTNSKNVVLLRNLINKINENDDVLDIQKQKNIYLKINNYLERT